MLAPFFILLGFVVGVDVTSVNWPHCTAKITHNCTSTHMDSPNDLSGSGGG
jgi:hypothetical protein